MKNITKFIVTLGFAGILCNFSLVSAHGMLVSQNKAVGDNQITFEATADAPEIYTKYAITYQFGLRDKSGQNEVAYDNAYIAFAKKDRSLIALANVVGPKDFMPGGQMDVAIQEPGDYVAEVTFVQSKPSGDNNEIRAEFDFKVVEGADIAGTGVSAAESNSHDAAKYAWGVIALIIGLGLGHFGSKVLRRS